MSGVPHISLDQWRSLIAVVDAGGYAQAAETLHKSQSAVTYAVRAVREASEGQTLVFIQQPSGVVLTDSNAAMDGVQTSVVVRSTLRKGLTIALTVTDGTSGTGLYASEDGPWTAAPSCEWAPSAAQR